MIPGELQSVAVAMGAAPQMRYIVYSHFINSHKFRAAPSPLAPPRPAPPSDAVTSTQDGFLV